MCHFLTCMVFLHFFVIVLACVREKNRVNSKIWMRAHAESVKEKKRGISVFVS